MMDYSKLSEAHRRQTKHVLSKWIDSFS